MNLTTTKTTASKLHPDVSFTFKKFSQSRYQEYQATTAEARYEIRLLAAQLEQINPGEGVSLDKETEAKIYNLSDKLNAVVDKTLNPTLVKLYLKSVEGLQIDDSPCTPDLFMTEAPYDLFMEVVDAIKNQAEVTPEETKN